LIVPRHGGALAAAKKPLLFKRENVIKELNRMLVAVTKHH